MFQKAMGLLAGFAPEALRCGYSSAVRVPTMAALTCHLPGAKEAWKIESQSHNGHEVLLVLSLAATSPVRIRVCGRTREIARAPGTLLAFRTHGEIRDPECWDVSCPQ